MIHEINLFITSYCNWNCSYCDIPYIENKHTTIEILNKHSYIFDIFNHYKIPVILTGGEPGLLPKDTIDYIFSNFTTTISVATNGIYYDRFNDKYLISDYIYHIQSNSDKLPERTSKSVIQYSVVVTRDNFNKVLTLLKINPNVLFRVRIVRSKLENQERLLLSKSQLKQLLYNTSFKPNIIDIKYLLKNYYDEKYNSKTKLCCKHICPNPTIDLVNERILRCCTGYTHVSSVPLNKENFLKAIFGYAPQIFPKKLDYVCKTCNRVSIISKLDYYLNYIYNLRKIYNEASKIF